VVRWLEGEREGGREDTFFLDLLHNRVEAASEPILLCGETREEEEEGEEGRGLFCE
jgi:hypothetical protein